MTKIESCEMQNYFHLILIQMNLIYMHAFSGMSKTSKDNYKNYCLILVTKLYASRITL